MEVSHENRVPCTTLQCSYNAARTSWLSRGYRLCQWVGQCNGQVDRVDHSWPELSRVEPSRKIRRKSSWWIESGTNCRGSIVLIDSIDFGV